MLLPKPIWVLIIVEYSTISTVDYFEDTLANVGLPEAWLEWYSNDVTQIKNKSIKRETRSIPRRPLFLHALSFECTTKLCINFLNQFLVYFHI